MPAHRPRLHNLFARAGQSWRSFSTVIAAFSSLASDRLVFDVVNTSKRYIYIYIGTNGIPALST